ncbi:MAG: single-stranded DNA-binding protein [Verrucomicrobiota bacterium]
MASYNKVILLGNLTRDPELRYTPKGTASARLGLAVNRSYKTDSGETREEVTFVDIDAWGKQAELIAQYLRKGNPLFVEGRLKLDQWDDKTSGQKRSAIRVVMENFQFLGGRAEGRPTSGPPSSGHSAPASSAAPAAGGDSGADGPPPEEDDVPF